MNALGKVLLSGLVQLLALGALLFLPAGTLRYWQAWVVLAVVFALATVIPSLYLLRADPVALQRRMSGGPAAEARSVQKLVMAGLYASLAAMVVVSAADHRFGWSRVPAAICLAGDVLVAMGLGAVIKDAKEQLRALPDGLSYGLLRYLNADVDLAGADPPIAFNYLGRLGAAAAHEREDEWRIRPDGWSVTGAAAAIPMPLPHTVELNAGTLETGTETDAGPQLRAGWTWALSVLDHAAVDRLSRLWFDALAGICAHVRSGGGGLTPSDIAAGLSQQQLDELARQYADR